MPSHSQAHSADWSGRRLAAAALIFLALPGMLYLFNTSMLRDAATAISSRGEQQTLPLPPSGPAVVLGALQQLAGLLVVKS